MTRFGSSPDQAKNQAQRAAAMSEYYPCIAPPGLKREIRQPEPLEAKKQAIQPRMLAIAAGVVFTGLVVYLLGLL